MATKQPWTCLQCGLNNSSSQIQCIACFVVNARKYWQCTECDLINVNNSPKCIACSTLKATITKKRNNERWKEHPKHKTPWIRENIIVIGSIIWYSTHYGQGESGMAAYNYKSNKIESVVKYPHYILQPMYHSVCSDGEKIYIVDGGIGAIILFDPLKKSFKKLQNITPIGNGTSCIVIDKNIHIMGSTHNRIKGLIYSITDDTVTEIEASEQSQSQINGLYVLKSKDMCFKFGGFDQIAGRCVDTFYASSMKNVEWKLELKYKLKSGLCCGGCVMYKQYIITFGGEVSLGRFTDKIYVLDLKCDMGWVELKHIQCPIAGDYVVILDGDDRIHLFSSINEWPRWQKSVVKHFSISAKEILPDVVVLIYGFMRIYIFDEGIIDERQYDISMNRIIENYVGILYI